MRRFGILYQSGALWSSMTLAENVALPLEQYTNLTPAQIRELVSLKLALVGLGGFEDFYPSEISGGMRKRAGLARAMALDPEILFFDEPSAGLDPVSARLLDDLILELRDSLGTTVVVVTHELASIFAIGNNSVFLDPDVKTMTASGDPKRLLQESPDPKVISFLTRGKARRRMSLRKRRAMSKEQDSDRRVRPLRHRPAGRRGPGAGRREVLHPGAYVRHLFRRLGEGAEHRLPCHVPRGEDRVGAGHQPSSSIRPPES